MRYLTLIYIVLSLTSCNTPMPTLNHHNNKYNLTTEVNLLDVTYSQNIDSLYNSGVYGTFKGEESVDIYYKIFLQDSNEKGAIVISSGRTEAAIKYKELIYDLYNNGYSVYINDHRGQGLSGRMVPDRDMGYVDEFQYYIDDLKTFYDDFIMKGSHHKIYLLSHSMGGAIAATYLQQYTNDFAAAAFSSPMLGFPILNCGVGNLLIGKEPKYIVGQTKYMDDSVEFKDNNLTYSQVRYNRMLKAFNETTEARLGGASYQWLNKSCKQFTTIFDNINSINTPLVLFSAENEKIVSLSAHNNFIDKLKALNKDALGYQVNHAMHELFIANDKQRIDVLTEILDFFNSF